MLVGLTVILCCQLVGEIGARGAGLPIPGPVLGMVLLLVLLFLRDRLVPLLSVPGSGNALETTGKGLLSHLSLILVPAGVGVIQNLELLGRNGPALAAALVGSTLAALVATVATFLLVARWYDSKRPRP
jgi:holin-like protein